MKVFKKDERLSPMTYKKLREIDGEKFKVIKISSKNKEIKDYNFVKKPYVEYADLINKSSENLRTVYSPIHNGSVNVQLINMSPKKYISECAKLMGVSEKVLRESREDENLNKYRANKNITFPIGYIDYVLKKQDGLHRAIVAEENKQNEIPVCIIKDVKMKVKDSNITQEIAKKLKQNHPEYDYGYTTEEVRIYNVPRGTKLQSVKNAVIAIIGSRDIGVQSVDQKGHIITIKIRDCDIMKKFKVKIGDNEQVVKAKNFEEAKKKVKDKLNFQGKQALISIVNNAKTIEELSKIVEDVYFYDKNLYKILKNILSNEKDLKFAKQEFIKNFNDAEKKVSDAFSGSRENGVIYSFTNGNWVITYPNGKVEKFPENKFNKMEELYDYIDKFKDAIEVKDDASYEWMRRLSNDDFTFINGGYGMKFKNAEKYNKAKRIAKEVGYNKGHWYDDKLEYFDYGSTTISNEDSVKDSGHYQVSYIKNNISMVNLVKANSEDEAKTKFINYMKKKGREVEVVAVKKANEIDVENAKRKGMPTIDKKIADKKWETVSTVYAKKPVNEAYSKQLLKEVTKNSVFKVVPMSGKSLLFKMSNGEQYSTQVYGDGSVGSEVKINKLVDQNKIKDNSDLPEDEDSEFLYRDAYGSEIIVTNWDGRNKFMVNHKGKEQEMSRRDVEQYLDRTGAKFSRVLRDAKIKVEDAAFSKKSKQGWEIVAMYQESGGRKYAIIKKPDRWFESGFGYIVALGYDESDGQWAQGIYDFATFDKAKNYLFSKYKVSKVFDEEPKIEVPIEDANVDAEHIANYMWTLPREVRTIMWNIIDDIAGKYKNKNEFGKALATEGHKQLNNLIKQIAVHHEKLKKEASSNIDLFVKDILNRNDIGWDKILKNV